MYLIERAKIESAKKVKKNKKKKKRGSVGMKETQFKPKKDIPSIINQSIKTVGEVHCKKKSRNNLMTKN